MNAYMYLSMLGNQLLSSIFADYISILSKLRQNTADIQGIRMDYHDKICKEVGKEFQYGQCLCMQPLSTQPYHTS